MLLRRSQNLALTIICGNSFMLETKALKSNNAVIPWYNLDNFPNVEETKSGVYLITSNGKIDLKDYNVFGYV